MNFELDRFAWTAGTLELSGRWLSDTPRRFRHVRLVVEVDGRRRRIAPTQQTPMRASPEGETWAATFPWFDDEPPEAPMLEAGQSMLIELPAPTRVEAPAPPSADVESLRAELQAERELVAALKRRLAAERAKQEEAQAEEAAAHKRELADAWRAAQELEAERGALAAEREQVAAEREQVAAEREQIAAERAELEAERARLAAPHEAPAAAARPMGALTAEPPERPPHRWDLGAGARPPANGSGPRHGAIQHALELPRQPDVRGKASLPVRIIAVTLSAGVLALLGLIVDAIF